MIRKDFVGRHLKVVSADNPDLEGIEGEVVDESKHTLRVRTDRGEKTIIKEQAMTEGMRTLRIAAVQEVLVVAVQELVIVAVVLSFLL